MNLDPLPAASGRSSLGRAALLAALLGGGQAAQAQGARGGHDMNPDAPVQPTVNLGRGAGGLGSATSGVPTTSARGHEPLYGVVLVEQLEYRGGSASNIAAFEGQALYGSDYNKVRISTRGEYSSVARSFERAELQLLYSRLVGYFFDAQAGVRQDVPIRPLDGTPARTHLVIGIQGLLPGLFELNLQGFVNQRGTASARLEASYDLYITQRLVLQPEFEVNFAVNADRQAYLGKGLTRTEAGLRLRYEFSREVSPYVGLSYERALGETSTIYRRVGQKPEILSAVAGLRLFF